MDTMDAHEFRDLAVQCLWEKLQVLPAGGRMDRIFFTSVDRINGKSTNIHEKVQHGPTYFVCKENMEGSSQPSVLVNLFGGFSVGSLGLYNFHCNCYELKSRVHLPTVCLWQLLAVFQLAKEGHEYSVSSAMCAVQRVSE